MIHIDASQLDHRRLNEQIRHSPGTLRITGCLGQRFIGAGAERGRLEITGTPGNALGAYCGGLPIARGLGYEYTALPGAGFTLLGLLTAVVYIRKYPRHAMR